MPPFIYARSSIGRVADSKSVGWGFKSLRACQLVKILDSVFNFHNAEQYTKRSQFVGKDDSQKPNPVVALFRFFGDSWVELKKVHFPTRQETIQSSIGVMLLVLFFAIILGVTDAIVGRVVQVVLNVNS